MCLRARSCDQERERLACEGRAKWICRPVPRQLTRGPCLCHVSQKGSHYNNPTECKQHDETADIDHFPLLSHTMVSHVLDMIPNPQAYAQRETIPANKDHLDRALCTTLPCGRANPFVPIWTPSPPPQPQTQHYKAS
jgi:hypothetical protein